MGLSASDKTWVTSCGEIERNTERCPCVAKPNKCANIGICCDCIVRHMSKHNLPRCYKDYALESEQFREHLKALVAKGEGR